MNAETAFHQVLAGLQASAAPLLPLSLQGRRVPEPDLSEDAPYAGRLAEPGGLEAVLDELRNQTGQELLAGGYAERRSFYHQRAAQYRGEEPRTLHLGLDLWLPAGTPVLAPLPGRVHSLANNAQPGDYGPTLILEHVLGGHRFWSLYGHLSQESLNHREGAFLAGGEQLGSLGRPDVNGDWPPHLHFQLIRHIGGYRGDFPGVARPSEAAAWLAQCPSPNLLLGMVLEPPASFRGG